MQSVTWKMGGEAGYGIMSSGTMLCRTFSRLGYHVLATNEYPSLIRGGHNLITVRIATQEFASLNKDVHILVALNKETVDLHKEELTKGAILLFDPKDHTWQATDFSKEMQLVAVPLADIVSEHKGDPVMRNTVALGATVALLGTDFSAIESVIRDQFKRKGQEVIDNNIAIAKAGYDHIKTNFTNQSSMFLSKGEKKEPFLVINGSEAVGVGAVRAGLKFAAIYPMTPINSVITFLADHAKELQLVYKQPEDEIAGINMAIGASIGGVRSMVATSGGGFALMVEGLSLAGILEVPLVIDLGMRPGPATGMPTWTGQGELQFAIHAGHGEFPRIILAPGDIQEAYSLTVDAFNLADRYQVPVFILTDKYLNESQWCAPKSHFQKDVATNRGKLVKEEELATDGSFGRYSLETDDGVSSRSLPGMKNGFYIANSYEHDEQGYTTELADLAAAMAQKRLSKLVAIQKVGGAPTVYGERDSEITFVAWGSTKGPILEAMKLLGSKGKKSKLIHFTWLFPFPTEEVTKLLSPVTRLVDVELNTTAQLAFLIREHTGISITEKILQCNGRMLYPEEIVERISKVT
ncbi:2-oxoacid:acceptor oxidoreductase subunit alpha [Candidatus Gottesmanbacteria bacterium]|nr:2-oxoacid:acceptor oxidoreductase subunit alpha [Candidatus Gottesmanbacteria bacterium]